MKTCIFLTLGLLIGSGSGYSIDRPAGSTDNLQPPPLTPYTPQTKPLPSSRPARLGIVPGTVPQAVVAQLELSGFPGVLVTKVMPDSPAAKAGLQENDVIIGIDGKRVKNFAELQEGLAKHRPGDKVTVKVLRDKKEKDIELTLKNEQGTTKVVKNAGMEILGAAFREVPQELKKQLNLGSGVEITGVTEGKMKAAGVRKGFIILKANGQVIRTVNDLEDVLKAATLSPDQVLFLSGMFPSGKRANYAVDLTQE